MPSRSVVSERQRRPSRPHQLVGLLRPRAAGRVDRQFAMRLRFFQASSTGCITRQPASIDVGALEQRGIADHAVVEQRLVAGAGHALESVLVAELHVDAVDLHRRARDLDAEAQGHALLGLDVQGEVVGRQALDRRVAEQGERRLLELDGDLGAPPRQRLAGAQVERHAGPAPVVDPELHGDEGLGGRVGRHVGRLAIGQRPACR